MKTAQYHNAGIGNSNKNIARAVIDFTTIEGNALFQQDNLTVIIADFLNHGISSFCFEPEKLEALRYVKDSEKKLSSEIYLRLDYDFLKRAINNKRLKDDLLKLCHIAGLKSLSCLVLDFQLCNFDKSTQKHIKDLKETGLVSSIAAENLNVGELDIMSHIKEIDSLLGSYQLNACSMSALEEELDRVQGHGLKYFNKNVFHYGLLSEKIGQFSRERPESKLFSDKDIDTAVRATRIARKLGISLQSLATRFSLSLANADKTYFYLAEIEDITTFISDINSSYLEEEDFKRILANIR